MAVRSVVDIEVNDGAFKKFQELFEKYQAQLAKTPAAWASVSKENKAAYSSFEKMTAALLAQNELARRIAKEEKEQEKAAANQGRIWRDMARNTKDVAGNIASATKSLLKWSSLTSVVSGLLGAGGLYGIDRLASSVGFGRRAAQGLGTSYGERRAFDLNFSRLVDSGSFLSGINEALHDVTKRSALYGAGLTEADLRGKSTAEVAAQALPKIKGLADQTPDALLGQLIQSRRLDQLGVSVQDLERLKATPRSELAGIASRYEQDRKQLELVQATQRAWQDLNVQLTRAGEKIENVFVKTLGPLAPQIDHLSDAVAGLVQKWGTQLAPAIDRFAAYLGSEKFQQDIKSFEEGIASLAEKTVAVLRYLGVIPTASPASAPAGATPGLPQNFRPGPPEHMSGKQALGYAIWGKPPVNNPLNLRDPREPMAFRQFPTMEAGIQAAARQLIRDEDVHHLTNLRQIIGDEKWGWAPASAGNDVESYVKDVSRRTAFAPEQPLDLHNRETLAALISAMGHHENSTFNVLPKTIVEVLNNTGGNAIVITSQVAQ